MWDKKKINEVYEEIGSLGKLTLPDKLWEGGLSTYKNSIDSLRGNQERMSTLIIEVSRELVTLRKAQKYGKRLLDQGIVYGSAKWPETFPNIDEVEDYLMDMEALQDSMKLIHGDLNRARSDLKSKVQLLEVEAKMGGSGSIDRANINESTVDKGVMKKSAVSSDHGIDWNS